MTGIIAGYYENLNLTYGVRDGIVSHCGEVDENWIYPRNEFINLEDISKPNQYSPCSWEGCVVKVSDKISYLGRDIEDARTINIINQNSIEELKKIILRCSDLKVDRINNAQLLHYFIVNVCNNSSQEKGIRFSDDCLMLINEIKKYNYENIYSHKKLMHYHKYAKLIIESIFYTLKELYDDMLCFNKDEELMGDSKLYPMLSKNFKEWLWKYSTINDRNQSNNIFKNKVIYRIEEFNDYKQAIIDFISVMTDNFAIRGFNELTSFA